MRWELFLRRKEWNGGRRVSDFFVVRDLNSSFSLPSGLWDEETKYCPCPPSRFSAAGIKTRRGIFVAFVASQRGRRIFKSRIPFRLIYFFHHLFLSLPFLQVEIGKRLSDNFSRKELRAGRAFINFFTLWWFSDRREIFRIGILPSKREIRISGAARGEICFHHSLRRGKKSSRRHTPKS